MKVLKTPIVKKFDEFYEQSAELTEKLCELYNKFDFKDTTPVGRLGVLCPSISLMLLSISRHYGIPVDKLLDIQNTAHEMILEITKDEAKDEKTD